jgi:hypothetical protein
VIWELTPSRTPDSASALASLCVSLVVLVLNLVGRSTFLPFFLSVVMIVFVVVALFKSSIKFDRGKIAVAGQEQVRTMSTSDMKIIFLVT